MSVKKLVQLGNPVLRAKAKKVDEKDLARVKILVKDLVDTMRATSLIGIAAPQIGVGLQVFCVEIKPTKQRKVVEERVPLRVFVNPLVVKLSKQQTVINEACGSLGALDSRLFGPVKRPAQVEIRALDLDFKPFTVKAKGLYAKCLQHELDHLQGVVILDKFADTKKCYYLNA